MNRLFVAVIAMLAIVFANADDAWQITSRGYGPVHAGISAEEASLLMGTGLHREDDEPPEPSCDYLYAETGHIGVGLMVRSGRVAHVMISEPGITTRSGIQVGDSTSRLKEVFGTRIEIQRHKYNDDVFYYSVWDADRRHGIRFEIGDDQVTTIYAGDDSIRLVEGCQ